MELIEEDELIWEAIDEISASTSGDVEELRQELHEEISARTEADEALNEAIQQEAQAREAGDGNIHKGGEDNVITISASGNGVIESFNGLNNIIIQIDGDFGTL